MRGRTTEIDGVTCIAKVESQYLIPPLHSKMKNAMKKSFLNKKRYMENPRKFWDENGSKKVSTMAAFDELARLQDIELDVCLKTMDRSDDDESDEDETEGGHVLPPTE